MISNEFCCELCNYKGKTKQNLNKHLLSNKHLVKFSEHKTTLANEFSEKISNIYEEMKSFKNELKVRDERIAKQEEIIKDLLFRISNLEHAPINHQVIVNGNGNVNLGGITQNISIKLQKYGHENLPNDMTMFMTSIKGVNTVIPNLVEFIHFHPKYPENNNIKIPNKKDNKIKIYNGTKWITQNKKHTLESKIQSTIEIFETERGKFAYNSCSEFIRSRLDETISSIILLGKDKLNRVQISDLKRIREDVENVILDNQVK